MSTKCLHELDGSHEYNVLDWNGMNQYFVLKIDDYRENSLSSGPVTI